MNIKESMKITKQLMKIIETHETQWTSMTNQWTSINSNPCKWIANKYNQWTSTKFFKNNEHPWTSTKINETRWQSLNINENPWMKLIKIQWKSMMMNTNKNRWKSIQIHKTQWTSTNMFQIKNQWKSIIKYWKYENRLTWLETARKLVWLTLT